METGFNIVAVINFFVNIILSFGLRYVWNLVNLLQFLVYMQRWTILYPANSLAFLKYIKSIALMEFIPSKQITDKLSAWLNLDAESPENLLSNLGLMLVIGGVIAVLMIAMLVCSYLVMFDYRVYRRFRLLQSKIFYNAILRYLLQSCLKLAVASCTTLTLVNWSDLQSESYPSIVVSSLILLVILISPIIFRIILIRNFNNLLRPSFVEKIGSLYLALRETDK